MTFRGQHIARCDRCRLETKRCMCAEIPRLDVRTRVVVLMHARELERPTNTGRLLPLMLPNASVMLRAQRDVPNAEVPELAGRTTLVLHPDADRELVAADAALDPVLLVPDGTWSQSRRLLRREPTLLEAVRVRLPPGDPGIYRLRKDERVGHLSTLEAVARAIGVLEGTHHEETMTRVLAMLVERMLLTRGRLRDDPILGVVPAGDSAANTRAIGDA